MAFFAVEFVLKFYARKVFLDFLGTEILGLNTTAVNLLQFLNLAELGIVSAVGFSLYGPIHNNDREKVNEIVTLQGHLYRRIAYIVIAGAVVMMCFFPQIFHKTSLPLWYAYASFIVLLYSALLGYFVNYRQIVLASAQMDYKISISTRTWNVILVISQILAVRYMEHPYVWWLALQAFFATVSSISLHMMTKHTFPWLSKVPSGYKELRDSHPVIITKIKQLFFHKIAGFALTQTSPLIIYAYISLTVVTYYGNYQLVTAGIVSLLNSVFNSMGAGIGDLIAEGDKKRIIRVFHELFSVRFVIGCIMAYAMMTLCQPFIAVWIGPEYTLPYSTLAIITAILFIGITRNSVDSFIFGYGIFRDIWAPVVESVLNIGLSVLLGYWFGLNGILAGVLVSLVLIVTIWRPILLYMDGFQEPAWKYFSTYAYHIAIGCAAGVLGWLSIQLWEGNPYAGWMQLISYGIYSLALFTIILCILMLITPGFRDFMHRFKR